MSENEYVFVKIDITYTIYKLSQEQKEVKMRYEEIIKGIEHLKCCGNCKHFDDLNSHNNICTYKDEFVVISGSSYCKFWDFDSMSLDKRKVLREDCD